MSSTETVISGNLWTEQGFRLGRLTLRQGRIEAVEFGILAARPGELAFGEAYVTPGLVELQLNGGLGHDFTRQPSSVDIVAAALPRWGVTGFLPTFITAPLELYRQAVSWLNTRREQPGARVLGVHLEGPYLNPRFRGAHEEQYIREADPLELASLLESGYVRLMTLAPEKKGAGPVIARLREAGVLVAAGHSGATYDEAAAGIQAGIRCATHLFNAMPPMHHRQPGLVGAMLEHNEVTVNLIVDGIHLHPALVRLIYRLKGAERIVLVSDAMAGMGMPPGRYDLGGQSVIVDQTSARLADAPDTLAGSILTLNAALRLMVEFSGCPPHEAVAMATLNPARLLGLDRSCGRLAPGYEADVAVFNPDFEPQLTLIGGQVAYQSEIQPW